MIEFETHGGWGRQQIIGHYNGVITMFNSGSQSKNLELVLGYVSTPAGRRRGSLHIATEQMDAIGMSLQGFDTAQYGTNNRFTGMVMLLYLLDMVLVVVIFIDYILQTLIY